MKEHQSSPKLIMHVHDWKRSYEFAYTYIDKTIRKRLVAEPLTMIEVPSGQTIEQPTFSLSEEDVHALMDSMWIAGIRPSNRIIEPQNTDHMNNEINWLRETADHLMKKPK